MKLIGYLGHKLACNCHSWRQSPCTFVCSSKHSGHQQDNAFKGSRASKDNASSCYSPTKTKKTEV